MLCYRPEEFCADYVRLVHAISLGSVPENDDPELREHLGYSIEQTLMRRSKALEDARARNLAPVEKRIKEADRDLLRLADYVFKEFGVDVNRFLSP